MNKNKLLRAITILIVSLFSQLPSYGYAIPVSVADINVAANPLPCEDGLYTLELTITYDEPCSEVFSINIGGVAFGEFSYEDYPSGSVISFMDLVANEEKDIPVTVESEGTIELPCVGTTTYTEAPCCTPAAVCNLNDTNLEACSIPLPFSDPEDVFTAIESCDGDIVMSSSDTGDLAICSDGTEADFTRTYELFIDGILVATCQQNITVDDETPPTISCPADQNSSCSDSTDPSKTGVPIVSDNCTDEKDIEINFSDVSTQGSSGCDAATYNITRTWTATDDCGNISTCVQTIMVADDSAPTISCPTNQDLACTDSTDPANTNVPIVSDDCTDEKDIEITFSDVSTQGTGCDEATYNITRTWTATDACGNSSSCMQTIAIVDNSPPNISCPADQNLICTDSTEPANTGNATASDNCTNDADIEITFSDVSTQGTGCDEATYDITRTWTATEACGNSSSCMQTIAIVDNSPPNISCPADQNLICTDSTEPANTG
ncbi:MAG: hypothetical protein AB8F74_04575, partial [Saprospiraceae bacterium]